MLLAKEDRKSALEYLDQAGELIDRSTPEKVKLRRQVGLASAYAYLKSRRGFAIIESMIPRLNQLVTAAMELDGIETSYVRDEEWNMNYQGVIGGVLATIANNAGLFAAIDLDRSVALANRLERPELRLMAELKIAQGVLQKRQPTLNFRGSYSPNY